MRNDIVEFASNTQELFRNTHLQFTLSGWPAAVALITICLSGVAVYGLNCYTTTVTSQQKTVHDDLLDRV